MKVKVVGMVVGFIAFATVVDIFVVRLMFNSDIDEYSRKLPDELANAKKIGMATTPDQLRKKWSLPDNENGASFADAAYKAIFRPPDGYLFNPKLLREPIPAGADLKPYQLAIAERKDGFAMVDRVVQSKGVDHHEKWELGISLLFPKLAGQKKVVRALAVRATLLEREGKAMEALTTLETALRFAQRCSYEPNLITKLVYLGNQGLVWSQIIDVISVDSSPAVLEKAASLASLLDTPDLHPVIEAELTMSRITLAQIPSAPRPAKIPAEYREIYRSTDAKTFRAYDARLIHEAALMYEGISGSNLQPLVDYDRRIRAKDSSLAGARILTEWSAVATTFQVATTRRDLMLEGIQILREHPKGDFPTSLRVHGIDPYSSKPFVYRKVGGGFVVYSVGRDGHDDGAKILLGKDGSKNIDIVWRYRVPLSATPLRN